jgi:hypothetical protein
MDALKRVVTTVWPSLTGSMAGIDYRMLLWLSYLDVRSRVFGTTKRRCSNSSPPEESLLDTVARKENLRSIYLKSRSYLKEGFGDRYPSSELRGDLLQDTINIKYADAMSLLSQIVSFAGIRSCHTSDDLGRVSRHKDHSEVQRLQFQLSGLQHVGMPRSQ